MQLKIDLYQVESEVGNIEGNANKIIQLYKESIADLVVFPELFLTGYNCKDLFLSGSFIALVEKQILKIAANIQDRAIIINVPIKENSKLYNSALVIQNGEIKHTYYKYFLPNNGVFDEKRYFSPGDKLSSVFELNGCKIRLMICEDIWYPETEFDKNDTICDYTLIINASPYSINKIRERTKLVKDFSIRHSAGYVAYLNAVGAQDNLLFDGNSFIVKDGELITLKSKWKEEKIQLDLNEDHQVQTVAELAKSDILYLNDEVAEDIYNGIILSLREYAKYACCDQFIIGLSGGIDSALAAVIAVEAVGPEKVLCVAMPSEYSSQSSLDDAEALIKNLSCKLEIIPINAIKQAFDASLESVLGKLSASDIANENIQPRIRSTILMSIANSQNRLLLCTSNKSESAVGYTTIYGDMSGAYAPIADLYKTQVYSLCKWLNKIKDIIPNSILEKEPSAELKPGQKDSDSLPEYSVLDKILYSLIELNENPNDELELKVQKMLYKSEFKRFQAPPAPKINSVMLSGDRRYPVCIKL